MKHIPKILKSQCEAKVQKFRCKTDSLVVNGRDVLIRVTVSNNKKIDSLKSELSVIPGIRSLDMSFIVSIDSLKKNWMRRLSEHVICFPKNSDTQKKSDTFLDTLIQFLKAYPDIHVTIRGWTDEKGDSLYNQRLSERRADKIRNELIQQECDSTRLTAIGFGEQRSESDSMTDSLARSVDFLFEEKIP